MPANQLYDRDQTVVAPTRGEKVMEPTLEQTDVQETETEAAAAAELVEEDLVVEEVSIDGMCGVY